MIAQQDSSGNHPTSKVLQVTQMGPYNILAALQESYDCHCVSPSSSYKGMTHADECENFKAKSGSLPAREDKLEKPPGFRQYDELCSIRALSKTPVRFVIVMIDRSRPEPREIARSFRSKSGVIPRQKIVSLNI